MLTPDVEATGLKASANKRKHDQSSLIIYLASALLLIIITSAIFGPMLSSYDGEAMDFDALEAPPSATHWFGTELAAQLDITRNRAEMLAGQQDGVQRELTQIETRFDMLSDRATTARRQAAQDKQDRANEQNGGTRRR